MNDDLISRSALLDDIQKTIEESGCVNHEGEMLDCIRYATAVNAVIPVRCAQFKHFKRNLENDAYCSCINGLTDPQEDDFCSYGERRTEGLA